MKKLLIVEDDEVFAAGLVRTFSRRGYSCFLADTNREALVLAQEQQPDHLLLDLNLGQETTQDLIPQLRKILPHSIIVVLTGFGSIPSTVRAIKEGANQYLCKPIAPDLIEQAFEEKGGVSHGALPLWDLENDHIIKVLEKCGGNISQAAKLLGLHRRTLQRRLKKIDPLTS